MTAPTLWQTARRMLALAHMEQPGRYARVDFGMVDESDIAALAAESCIATEIQPSGQMPGGVLESFRYDARIEGVIALCTRPERPGDEERMRR